MRPRAGLAVFNVTYGRSLVHLGHHALHVNLLDHLGVGLILALHSLAGLLQRLLSTFVSPWSDDEEEDDGDHTGDDDEDTDDDTHDGSRSERCGIFSSRNGSFRSVRTSYRSGRTSLNGSCPCFSRSLKDRFASS